MRKTILMILALFVAPMAFATNGYFTHGQGTQSKAMAGATSAIAQDSLDAETNPAAAAFVNRGYSASLALFSPDRHYTVTGNPSGLPQTFGLTPGTVTSKSKYFPMPAIGFNFRPTSRDAFNVDFVAHGGMNTDYRTNTFYGSTHTGVDLAQAFLSATYARRLNENHAFGISAVMVGQRFKASGLEAFAPFTSDPDCLTNNGYETSRGVGVKFGYLGHLMPNLSIGAAFAPRVKMSELKNYCGLFAQDGRFDVPTSFNAGVAYQVTEPLTLTLDYQRIHYNDVRSVGNGLLPNLMTSPLGSDGGAGFGWQDINIAKVGVQWRANADYTFRAGYSKCDEPIQSSDVLFNILAPGVVQQHFTVGMSKALANRPGKVNFAFMYAPSRTVSGANPLEVPGGQTIGLTMKEWEFEIGYSFGN